MMGIIEGGAGGRRATPLISRSGSRRLMLALAGGITVALAAAGGAGAATVSGDDRGSIGFRAASGENNDVTIETRVVQSPVFLARSAVVEVRDAGAPLTAEGACASTGLHTAVCTASGLTVDSEHSVYTFAWVRLGVLLGDGDDRVVTSGEDESWIDDGPGADYAETWGTVVASPGPDRISAYKVRYGSRTTPVSVTHDGLANDGAAGEGDNILHATGVEGGSAADRIEAMFAEGGDGDDHLVGMDLDGGKGADLLEADRPGDLTGGPGTDRLIGSDGDDSMHSEDDAGAEADEVDCRGGTDWVFGDKADRVVNCENMRGMDSKPPESRLLAPEDLAATPLVMPFTVTDPEPTDGMLDVEAWVQAPGDTEYRFVDRDFMSGGDGKLSFSPSRDGEYRAYSIATDNAFNNEAPPAVPDITFRIERSAPSVVSHTPAAGATRVGAATAVTITFSESMDKLSAQQAFSLRREDGTAVAGSFTWSGTTMTFAPSKRLARTTRYTAAVSAGAKDEAGRALANPTSWVFTTG